MSCHGNNNNGRGSHKHSPLKHLLHMAICCGLPIVILSALPLISRLNPAAAGVLEKITPFLCPLMMLAMLPMMFGGGRKGSCCDNKDEKEDTVQS